MQIKDMINEKLDYQTVAELMQHLGVDCRNGRYRTACHGGNGYNLAYYPDSQLFYCYSGCGAMDVVTLVSRIKRCDWRQAAKFVCDILGIKYSNRQGFHDHIDLNVYRDLADLPHTPSFVQPVKSESLLNYFDKNTFYKGWIDEGISIDTMERFGIEWYEVGKWIIIPVRNINGELIGIRRRSLNPDEPKYMPICSGSLGDYSFSTGLNLYGLYENQDIIRKRQSCYLFEGEKSVLKCASWYNYFPCAACYSHNIGHKQIDLLMQLRVNDVTLCFDYDGGNEQDLYQNLCNKVNNRGINCTYLYDDYEFHLDKHDAPVDKGQAVFEALLKKKRK